jgi:putative glutamine amidotransferase
MSARRLIGISGSARRGAMMWRCNWLSVVMAGARPLRLMPGDGADWRRLDGLVIGGGDDIAAEHYQGKTVPTIRIDPERDRMELDLLAHAEKRGLPVIGICRGAQMMNVFRGGDLWADIRTHFEGFRQRRTVLPLKRVRIDPGSQLRRILGVERIRVNSLHHQSVNRLGAGLRAVAHDRYNIVQAIEGEGERFFMGVQWHPEFLFYRGRQHALFRALVERVD